MVFGFGIGFVFVFVFVVGLVLGLVFVFVFVWFWYGFGASRVEKKEREREDIAGYAHKLPQQSTHLPRQLVLGAILLQALRTGRARRQRYQWPQAIDWLGVFTYVITTDVAVGGAQAFLCVCVCVCVCVCSSSSRVVVVEREREYVCVRADKGEHAVRRGRRVSAPSCL